MDAIKAEIEKLEGFRVNHDEMILKVYHWGTEVGVAYHYGSYLDITPSLINELAKYDLKLEAFMVAWDINYKLIKPKSIKYPKIRPDLHYTITWTGDHVGTISHNDITCWFSYNHRKEGEHIELIYQSRPRCSDWPDYLIGELKPWFDALWYDIKTNNRKPREFNLAQRIGSHLPLGYKAYSDGFNKAEVQRTKKKYAYMTQRGDRYLISKQPIPKEHDYSTESLTEAVALLLKNINNQ
ncbi:hypothetical protein [Okeania sp. SIO1I7]|uniref:hypothetical protein n=1 Tax=Okeania sp. SIO1I7 TaxID=2607772 RepID=UPI0013FC57C3|nr:hypothetical protein [Okeania sp. SIO1I7]NET29984.1 hypothetical protein [Okeania sp. SIO1I7]